MKFTIRPFRRGDRDQLTALVNAHVEAVMPGSAIPINTVLAQLEREPDEFIVDPWVAERVTLVAEQSSDIVAAALLHRYRADADIPNGSRGIGMIRWLLFKPVAPTGNPHWPDANDAADALMAACIVQFAQWKSAAVHVECSLRAPAVYGVPEQWPHIAALLRRSGFSPTHRESVHLADLGFIPPPDLSSTAGTNVRRAVGMNGTRFTATGVDGELGYIEVGRLTGNDRRSGPVVADIGNLWIADDHQRQGIGTSLLRHAADWLRLGRVDLLLAYSWPDTSEDSPFEDFLAGNGFRVLTTTERGWARQPGR